MSEDEFVTCDDCPKPGMCLTYCGIQQWVEDNKNVAMQRGETPEQLWGITE
jgi:hypothetical protein